MNLTETLAGKFNVYYSFERFPLNQTIITLLHRFFLNRNHYKCGLSLRFLMCMHCILLFFVNWPVH